MTKDELIQHILQFRTPHEPGLLRQYSRQRLEDYLEYLQKMGVPRKKSRPTQALST